MKILISVILILYLSSNGFAQDSIKKHNFKVSTYPSNLFVGDMSVGFEHSYKKRWSQETMLFAKYFGPGYSFYKYDRGLSLNYLLKYNFIDRKRIRMSATLSFTYKNIYFNNKQDLWIRDFSHTPDERRSVRLFSMNRSIKAYGPGGGISFNYNINKNLSFGSDLLIEYLNTQRFFNVNDPEKLFELYPEFLSFPEYYQP